MSFVRPRSIRREPHKYLLTRKNIWTCRRKRERDRTLGRDASRPARQLNEQMTRAEMCTDRLYNKPIIRFSLGGYNDYQIYPIDVPLHT